MFLLCLTAGDSDPLKCFLKNVGVTGILDFLRLTSLVDSVPPKGKYPWLTQQKKEKQVYEYKKMCMIKSDLLN